MLHLTLEFLVIPGTQKGKGLNWDNGHLELHFKLALAKTKQRHNAESNIYAKDHHWNRLDL